MAEQILAELKQSVSQLVLEPSGGGCFELSVDGQPIYSKLETGEFPEERQIVAQLQAMKNGH